MDYSLKEDGGFQYIEKGEGQTIVVLHGLFGALSNFKDVFEYFSRKYRVVIPMLPIFSHPVFAINVKILSEYFHDFIEYKKYDNLNLLGNSLGGHVALVYASQHLEKINSMILTGSSGLYENAMGGSFPRREDYNFIKQKVEYTFYDPRFATKELVDECFEIVNDRVRLARILSLAKSAIHHNMSDELVALNVPVCLIWGKNDNITPPDVAEEFHKLLPQSDLFWIDKCGHAAMMEHPQEFNEIVEKWLNKLFN